MACTPGATLYRKHDAMEILEFLLELHWKQQLLGVR